jgi:glycerol uptake facilitator-like aquaporin
MIESQHSYWTKEKKMTNSYVQGLLGQNERIVLATRQHWFVLFSNIVLEIVLTLVLIVGVSAAATVNPLAGFGFILVLVPLIGMLRDILVWPTASTSLQPPCDTDLRRVQQGRG